MTSKTFISTILTLLIGSLSARALDQGAPSEFFPPLPPAAASIHWQDGYFYANGKPVIISSGSIHYARVPREQWRDRIWRLKMMGFNCVQSYVFWNATEPKEGVFELSDSVDLDAWLSLLQEMGMYSLVRVGPYACAEWEEGGTPAWLTIKPGMIQREMGPSVPYSDVYLAKIEGIVAKHQISHGGNVILVQLENEHSNGWGTQVIDPYLKELDDHARANGIDVPIFNSGEHHSSDPAEETPFANSNFPWYSTEFWTGWINRYGDMDPGMLNQKIAGTWKILAFGGAGYNYYMAFGGTNFGYSGSGELPGVSYDYSAPIGEAGQLRNFYFPARRAAYFGQTFTSLLTSSKNDPSLASADKPELRVTTRTSAKMGSIVFIDHFKQAIVKKDQAEIAPDANAYHAPKADPNAILETHLTVGGETLPHQGSLKVAVSEPRTVVLNFAWTDNVSFKSICTNVLFRQTIGSTDYWVCYGPGGDTGEINLERKQPTSLPAQLDFTYPTDQSVTELPIDSGDGHQAKLLIMNTAMTNHTWFANGKLCVGPSFVMEDGSLEFPPEGGKATIYAASGKSEVTQPAAVVPNPPALTSWTWRDAATERLPDCPTDGWQKSTGPQPLETYDGFENRYGWYRTTFHQDAAGPVSLHFGGASGTLVPFVNGVACTAGTFLWGESATLQLPNVKAGDNTLAIFVKATARSKATYHGPVGTQNARGIWGAVSFDPKATPLAITWKESAKQSRDANPADLAKPEFDDANWTPLDSATLDAPLNVPHGNNWFRGTFTLNADQTNLSIETPLFFPPIAPTKGKPSPAPTICYINGHALDERAQNVAGFLVAGKNSILFEIQSRLGDIGKLSISSWHNSPLTQATWYFHPGLDNLEETAVIGRATNWDQFLNHQPWQPGSPQSTNQPTLWKCSFTYHQPTGLHESLGLVTKDVLKAGHVWLNGHNLGESPQPFPLYMPECWLKEGDNDLVVFDLYGTQPDKLQVLRYEAFSVASTAK